MIPGTEPAHVPFPSLLKSSRLSAHLTQSQAAQILKVSRRAVQQWESGERTPLYPAQYGAVQLLTMNTATGLNAITYTPSAKSSETLRVKLKGRHVGEVRHDADGWRYYPKGQKVGGDAFPSLHLCKMSLLSP